MLAAVPAQHFWDPEVLRKLPGLVLADDRPGAPPGNAFWAGNFGATGQVLHGYQSAWLPAALLGKDQQERLAEALFASSRHGSTALHFNKGLAGAPAEALTAAADTAMNAAVLDAFALAIIASEGPPAFPGIPGHEPDVKLAREEAAAIDRAMQPLLPLAPQRGSYVSEGNYFDARWQDADAAARRYRRCGGRASRAGGVQRCASRKKRRKANSVTPSPEGG